MVARGAKVWHEHYDAPTARFLAQSTVPFWLLRVRLPQNKQRSESMLSETCARNGFLNAALKGGSFPAIGYSQLA
jgi:hypothetical protein